MLPTGQIEPGVWKSAGSMGAFEDFEEQQGLTGSKRAGIQIDDGARRPHCILASRFVD